MEKFWKDSDEAEEESVPDAWCVRCKQSCIVVEDCYEHEFGRTPFLESDCCGAPVVWEKDKK